MGAADTFRAAAIEQLEVWSQRIGIEGNFCISHKAEVDELIRYCRETGVEVLFSLMRDNITRGNMPDEMAATLSAVLFETAWYGLVNGKRSVYILVTKRADASTCAG